MDMQFKIVRNTTNVEQIAIFDGKRVALDRYDEQRMPIAVAEAFLEQCRGRVVESDSGIGGVFETGEEQTQYLWIYNATGNKDEPEHRQKRRHNKMTGEKELVNFPNSLREAVPLIRYMDKGMIESRDRNGKPTGLNQGKMAILLPPFKRIRLQKPVARWFLNRDAGQEVLERGKARLSRPPSAFEPDASWSLDDMRAYLRLMDSSATLPPSQTDIEEAYKKDENLIKRKKSPSDPRVIEQRIEDAKAECLKALHFRVCDPNYRLFTQQEFYGLRANMLDVDSGIGTDAASALVERVLASEAEKKDNLRSSGAA